MRNDVVPVSAVWMAGLWTSWTRLCDVGCFIDACAGSEAWDDDGPAWDGPAKAMSAAASVNPAIIDILMFASSSTWGQYPPTIRLSYPQNGRGTPRCTHVVCCRCVRAEDMLHLRPYVVTSSSRFTAAVVDAALQEIARWQRAPRMDTVNVTEQA
jgi:hypothetical protein